MAASAAQPTVVRRESRIIERPRLIKLLDETDARTILLLAPAGYGKTTLARQWAKTLNGAVWVTLSAEDRDIAAIATKVARAGDPDELGASAYVTTYLKAHSNPQRMATEVARVVAEQLRAKRIQWVVIDDYHEISAGRQRRALRRGVEPATRLSLLIRVSPPPYVGNRSFSRSTETWSRSIAASWPMSREESRRVLAAHPDFEHVVAQAEGWPAVIGLVASARGVRIPGPQLSSSLLHTYFTEELFKTAGQRIQRQLMRLALAPDLETADLHELFDEDADSHFGKTQQSSGFSARRAEVRSSTLWSVTFYSSSSALPRKA